jgi:hypothetical protein
MNGISTRAKLREPNKSRVPLWDAKAAEHMAQVIVQGPA